MPKNEINDTANFCDNITLTAFTQIQAYGALLVINKKNFKIIQYSENSCDILKTPASDLHNQELSLFLSMAHSKYGVKEWLQNPASHYGHFVWKYNQILLGIWVTIHHQNDVIILEIEIDNQKDHENYMAFLMDEGINLDLDFSSRNSAISICEKIQNITHYDRVILYKFEDDWSGVVIGEALKKRRESYLGLHFPATDIPHYVREMYLRQPIRYIPNIYDESVALVPETLLNANSSLDLSEVVLRAVSPVHIEYIRNMGSAAAVSVAIICKNKLWGLIALQNKEPKEIPIYCRFSLVILAKLISKQLLAMDDKKADILKETENKIDNSFQRISTENTDFPGVFEAMKDILSKVLCADGVAYVVQNQISMSGTTPTMQEIKILSEWLFETHPKLYATHELSSEYAPSMEFKDVASGLLAIPCSLTEKKHLLFFRKEMISDRIWAGDPEDVLVKTESEYSPRSSFKRWRKSICNQSKKWTSSELSTAELIQQKIKTWQLQFITNENKKIAIHREEETKQVKMMQDLQAHLEKRLSVSTKELTTKDKKFTSALEQLHQLQDRLIQTEKMATLGQLAAGVAHEINNPLCYVLSNLDTLKKYFEILENLDTKYEELMKELLQNKLDNKTKVYENIIQFKQETKIPTVYSDINDIISESKNGAIRIKDIVFNLKNFSSTSTDPSDPSDYVNVNEVIEKALLLIWNELKHKCTVVKNFSTLPSINISSKQIEMVFVNLLLNAVQSITKKGEIIITTSVENSTILVTVADNGTGISPEHQLKLFTPFFTTKPIGTATGFSLASSYAIIKACEGTITVNSELGRGSSFTVHLPIKSRH